jgi:hypothetical protein
MAAPIWQVGGQWTIQQGGIAVEVDVRQTGDRIQAACSHSAGHVLSEHAEGFVNNTEFQLNIKWNNDTEGRYIGKFLPGTALAVGEARLAGATVDLLHPESSASWEVFNRTFRRA